MNRVFFFVLLLVLVLPITIQAHCEAETSEGDNKTEALKYKLIALASILIAGAIGVSLPILGKFIPALRPENDIFFAIKAFAAGVILSTGCVHVLPDSFDHLSNPCLSPSWTNYPFGGLFMMCAAVGTMMVDQVAHSHYKRVHFEKEKPVSDVGEEEKGGEHDSHVHVHTHATHGHAHGAVFGDEDSVYLVRRRIISQVLEVGIVVHSVIMGVSLGASQNPNTIKPFVAAITFHQFFEGMGLGGCISQAKFKGRAIAIMSIFFSLTTPAGIAIGFGISNIYHENSTAALLVEGIFNAASAGILIYMALVDLLAADFMNPKVQNNLKLLLSCDLSLILGMACMSVLAKWA